MTCPRENPRTAAGKACRTRESSQLKGQEGGVTSAGPPPGQVLQICPRPRWLQLPKPRPRPRGFHPPVQSMPDLADRLACTVSAAPRAIPTRTQTALLSPRGIWDQREGAVRRLNLLLLERAGSGARKRPGLGGAALQPTIPGPHGGEQEDRMDPRKAA